MDDLSSKLETVRKQRILQRLLPCCAHSQRTTVNRIVANLSHEEIASLAGCALTWFWIEDLGGMLVLSGFEVPAIASHQSQLDQFLMALLTVTGITMVSIVGDSSYPLHCQWDGEIWGCRVKVQPGQIWEATP